MKFIKLLPAVALCLCMFACNTDYVPKPKGYNRIDLPDPAYQALDTKLPYTFEYSKHSKVEKDRSANADPHDINLVYPQHAARVHLTYKSLQKNKAIANDLFEDARRLTAKHQVRADAIDELIMKTDKGNTVYLFELSGDVPSQFQFYATDSTDNFLRGALYFPTSQKNDSLAPVINYIKSDMIHLLKTLEWETIE
jgi:gliding motility-associated lipoprotein GldD